jgi:hypothetical protein
MSSPFGHPGNHSPEAPGGLSRDWASVSWDSSMETNELDVSVDETPREHPGGCEARIPRDGRRGTRRRWGFSRWQKVEAADAQRNASSSGAGTEEDGGPDTHGTENGEADGRGRNPRIGRGVSWRDQGLRDPEGSGQTPTGVPPSRDTDSWSRPSTLNDSPRDDARSVRQRGCMGDQSPVSAATHALSTAFGAVSGGPLATAFEDDINEEEDEDPASNGAHSTANQSYGALSRANSLLKRASSKYARSTNPLAFSVPRIFKAS